MQFVKIRSTPAGEAPDHIRQAWVGLVLPVVQSIDRSSVSFGVISAEPMCMEGFEVPAQVALRILELEDPEAADWWVNNTEWSGPTSILVFPKDACECL